MVHPFPALLVQGFQLLLALGDLGVYLLKGFHVATSSC
jgi:hypothetical protein